MPARLLRDPECPHHAEAHVLGCPQCTKSAERGLRADKLEGTLEEKIIPFEKLIAGDERMRMFPRVNTDAIQRELISMELSASAPDDVKTHVKVAKQLCVAGYFFYELFSRVVCQAVVACEVALKHRYALEMPLPSTLASKKAERRLVLRERANAQKLFALFSDGWRLEKDNQFAGNLSQLITWATKIRAVREADLMWWRNNRELRNRVAHGSTMVVPPGVALGFLQRAILLINSLFPTSESEKYRAKVEARFQSPDGDEG